MVKHVILWTLKDEFSEDEKANIKAGIKEGLESLKGKIPGLVEIKVNINVFQVQTQTLCLIHFLKMRKHSKAMLFTLNTLKLLTERSDLIQS